MAISDSVAVGIASAAGPFLPVFLARLGASNVQVSLLTAMPALAGLLLAIPIGQFLARRRNVVPWFATARLFNQLAYSATAVVSILASPDLVVPAVLAVWAFTTLTQVTSMIAFSVVMSGISGPRGRFDLMSRRWSVLGLMNALGVAVVGQVLDRLGFPVNYQAVFLVLGLGGFASFAFTRQIRLRDNQPVGSAVGQSARQRLRGFAQAVRGQTSFVRIVRKRMVWAAGARLALPLIPLYYVREVNATDAEIGVIATTQAIMILVGYTIWRRTARRRGSRSVLVLVTFGAAVQPLLLSMVHDVTAVTALAGLAAVFQAGVDLALFDELMKTVPRALGTRLVAVDQSALNAVAVTVPLLVAVLTATVGLGGALVAAGLLMLAGASLFALDRPRATS